jgi:hypothetical protein
VSETPDFKVMRAGRVIAFCEVKSPRDDWLDEQIDAAPPGQLAGGHRPDPTFNRIARLVKKAASQFDAVNADRSLPNILVLVNHADASNVDDLVVTLTGTFVTDSGEHIPTVRHLSEGRIRQARHRIDLYVWIDVKTSAVQYRFNDASQQRFIDDLCNLLGRDPSDIQDIR